MKNIHVLPTDRPSRLVLNSINNDLFLTTTKKFPSDIMKFKNIYITSDEKIKEGDYYLPFSKSIVKKTTKYGEIGKSKTSMDFSLDYLKKIILTTDQDLIKDGVQKINDEFLEWFVKNPSCEWVEIREGFADGTSYGYKIIIPKEKPKQETTADYIDRHLVEAMIEVAKQDKNRYSEEEVKHLMALAFEQGFKKADVVLS